MNDLDVSSLINLRIDPLVASAMVIVMVPLLMLLIVKSIKNPKVSVIFFFTLVIAAIGMTFVPIIYAPAVLAISIFLATILFYIIIISSYKKARKDIGQIQDEMSVKIKAKLEDEKQAGIAHERCPECGTGELVTYGNGPVLGVFCSNFPKCMYFSKKEVDESEIKKETTNDDGIEEKYKNDEDDDVIKNL